MAADGSFPRELKRTKPYGYSLFNLDAMTMVCHILTDSKNDLWKFQTADGKTIRKAIEFLSPYIKNKQSWPYAKDVMYWDQWPVAHPSLVMGALAFKNKEWLETWRALDHDPQVEEVDPQPAGEESGDLDQINSLFPQISQIDADLKMHYLRTSARSAGNKIAN